MENQTLQHYLEKGVKNTVKNIARASFKNPAESLFLASFAKSRGQAEKARTRHEGDGLHIPPFLIASITHRCNLHCTGCYARANHLCTDDAAVQELAAADWRRLFSEARQLGVSFILLAGGEPFLRPEVLAAAAAFPDILFPVFTNGTLFKASMLIFLKAHRNLVPVLSIEGGQAFTDDRRGPGTHARLMDAMAALKNAGILYGASVTVTRDNQALVTSQPFLDDLESRGCAAVIFVEYVPVCAGTAALAPTSADRRALIQALDERRSQNDRMLLIAFPGDEAASGGCLAAGRGFFHISPTGDAEPCPFSPYSDTNLRNHSLKEALASPLFRRLADSGTLTEDHNGACVLFEAEDQVRRFAAEGPALP